MLSERITIERMLNEKASFTQIARVVGKNRSTISREVQNHCTDKSVGKFNKNHNDCFFRNNSPRFMECDNEWCNRKSCSSCSKWCGKECPSYRPQVCKKLLAVPYVYNGCDDATTCTLTKALYEAEYAENKYKRDLIQIRHVVQELDTDNVASKRRNPVIADIFSRMRFMERRGSGFKKIKADYRHAVNYHPEVEPMF